MTPIDDTQLEPELTALLDAERAAPAPSPAAQARVWERVEATLAAPVAAAPEPAAPAVAAPAVARAVSKGFGATGLKLLLAAGAVATVAVLAWPHAETETDGVVLAPTVQEPAPAPTPTPTHFRVQEYRTLQGASQGSAWTPTAVAANAAVLPAPAPKAMPVKARPTPRSRPAAEVVAEPVFINSPPVKAAAPEPAASLAAELRLLRAAREALQGKDPAAAMAQLSVHASRYPTGHLAEEREALAVQSLVAQGQNDAAWARARRFEDRYPRSLMLSAVRSAIANLQR